MKINGPTSSGGTTASGPTVASRPARNEPAVSGNEEVRLSPVSAELAANGGEATVDAARVQEIRQAIAEGRFQINPGAIADRLITAARELVDSQRKA